MLDTCLFSLERSLVSRPKISNPDMVLNLVEVEEPQQRPTLTSISNFGVNMVIGLPSKAKNVT